ncbi:MAG: LPS export ABC transporter periplasmic protein LptC [Salibacteraceae bacterium]
MKTFVHIKAKKFIPILWIGMLVLGCENDLEEVDRVTSREDLPLQTIINSKIIYSNNGNRSMMIEAGRIDRYPSEEDPRDEFSNGLKVTSYNNSGEVESVMTANRATNFSKTKLMIARDSVELENSEGKRLNTELLTWNGETKKIYTDKFVKITTPTEILFGDGLEAEEDFSKYEIMNIKGRIKIEEDDSLSTDEPNPEKTK